MPRPRVDPLFLEAYREHAGAFRVPACGCSIVGPDRDCDVGYSLYAVAVRNGDPQPSGVFLALMR